MSLHYTHKKTSHTSQQRCQKYTLPRLFKKNIQILHTEKVRQSAI